MYFVTFALAFAPLIIPASSIPTPVTSTAAITPAGTKNLLAELSAAYALSSSDTIPTRAHPDKIFVNNSIEINEEYLANHQAPDSMRATSTSMKMRRQTQDEMQFGKVWNMCRIQCETSSNSPLSQDVIRAGEQLRYYTGIGWGADGFALRGGNPMDRSTFCTELFPNQYSSGIGISGTAATGICGNSGVRLLTYAQAGWLIQQIGTTCQWNGQVAGGFAECWESDHFVRIQAFRS